ncbi:hypothetical protein CSKR_105721 [Clonorchis sinensis]|uniref:Uncharacterized protein n=2 Tax=Clonorchis sinensis TaxID=79923 RepID=G7YSC5_CLOSI|nr:hypothetical protein CSKR_105721 [Clonorchis sinensis]GAA55855.1 hypothetical protein CLF_109187 [Clonorchis sinensis]
MQFSFLIVTTSLISCIATASANVHCGRNPMSVFKRLVFEESNGTIDPKFALGQLEIREPRTYTRLLKSHRDWLLCIQKTETGYFKREAFGSSQRTPTIQMRIDGKFEDDQ